jgi:hypothetical protein
MMLTRLWILISFALLSACVDRVVISPQIPVELLTPVAETEVEPTTVRTLALAFAEQTGALREANGKIEAVGAIVSRANDRAETARPF